MRDLYVTRTSGNPHEIPSVTRIRNEKIIQAFGENVRRVRESKGMTKERLSDLAGIDRQQVIRVEKGTVNPTISTAYQIAMALDVPLASLLDFDVTE